MIVMKFGGSSSESAGAIEQAAAIVERSLTENPSVLVSAARDTTDRWLEATHAPARGNFDTALQQVEHLRHTHREYFFGPESGSHAAQPPRANPLRPGRQPQFACAG